MDKVTIHVLKDTFAQTLCNLILYSCKMNFFLSGFTQLGDVKSYSNTKFVFRHNGVIAHVKVFK